MRSIALMRVSLLALAAFASACGGGSSYGGGSNNPPACSASTATPTTSVSLSGMAFVPSCVKISAGETVTFQNADMATHTVTDADHQPPAFNSTLMTSQEVQHAFATAGTYHVYCTIHTYMTATIIVQ